MRGVILAGGTGSRLFPLTKVTNKHLLPVGRYPMIFHPVAKLAEAGITKILVVTGTEHMGAVVGTLGSGRELGLDFTYRVQDEPGGIAQALSLADDFVGSERFVVILGDNVFADSIAPFVAAFSAQERGARVLLSKVPDPQRFGVAEIEGNRIARVVEKPARPASPYIVTGIYMYDGECMSFIRELKPSGRGEFEITDVNNRYLGRSLLAYDILPGWWTDAGTGESLARANQLAKDITLPVFDGRRSYTPPAEG